MSDFISASLWLGIVDRVVWIRSDLPGIGRYNGPPPGRYKVRSRAKHKQGSNMKKRADVRNLLDRLYWGYVEVILGFVGVILQ